MASEQARHFKMYKHGKQWVTAGITLFSISLMVYGTQTAQADETVAPAQTTASAPANATDQTSSQATLTPTSAVSTTTATSTATGTPASQAAQSSASQAATTAAVTPSQRASTLPGSVEVTKDNFEDYFALNGSASYDKNTGILTLTPDENNRTGNATLENKIDLSQSFNLEGQINTGSNPKGADGIGFGFHDGDTDSVGAAGNAMGIGGLSNAFGYKVDTYHNAYGSEPGYWSTDPSRFSNDSFGSFMYTDDKNVTQTYQDNRSTNDDAKAVDYPNGQFRDIDVNYDGATHLMTVDYDGRSWTTDITRWGDPTKAYAFLISAATGGSKNLQQYRLIEFNYVAKGTVHVKYVDDTDNGREIIDEDELDGDVADTADAASTINQGIKTVQGLGKGYQHVTTIADADTEYDSASGQVTFTTIPGEIIVHFSRQTSAVTVHYVDENGTSLAAETVNPTYPDGTNYVGDRYATTQLAFPGYTFKEMATNSLASTGTLPDQGSSVTYVYVANNEHAIVTYIDDDTNTTLHIDPLTSQFGTTSDYRTAASIKNYEDQGYELVSDGYPTGGVVYNQPNVVQAYEVHFKHGTVINEPETKQVIQTVHYVYEDGTTAASTVTDVVNFTRTSTTNPVTGDITHGDWVPDNGDTTFVTKTSPNIPGYTPDQAAIAEVTGITADSADQVHTVIYKANVEHATVTYIDDTEGETLHSQALTGAYKTTDDYKTAPTIAGYENQGYVLVSDNYPTAGVVYDQPGVTQRFEVHFVHGVAFDENDTKQVTQTVHYVYEDGTTAAPTVTDTVNFTRTMSVNTVTGEVTPGSWVADDGKTTFETKVSPAITGYTPDQAAIAEVLNVTADSNDEVHTVVYTANTENATVTYIDDVTGKTLLTKPLQGKYGTTDEYRTTAQINDYKDHGYELVSDNYPATGVFYNQGTATPQQFVVHLTHGTDTYTPGENPENLDLTHEIHETIHYVYADGTTAADDKDDLVTFTRTATYDKITGEVLSYSPWVAENDDTTFDEKQSPEIVGYVPDQAMIPEITGLTADSADYEATVVYKAEPTEPAGPDEPGTSVVPGEPTPGEPSLPGEALTPGTESKPDVKTTPTTAATKSVAQADLPKTGEQATVAPTSLWGLLLLGAGTLLFAGKRKKHTN
ncbi:mucin-binding protein [Furfurilactobacillus sp. WILCCON 0119]